MHAKYQCSIFNTSEDMSQVKVFVTDRRTDGGTDGRTDGRMRFDSGGQLAGLLLIRQDHVIGINTDMAG